MPKQRFPSGYSQADLDRTFSAGFYEEIAYQQISLANRASEGPDGFKRIGEAAQMAYAINVRIKYRWPWGDGAEYLYRELIKALDLQHREEELLRLAKPSAGRKRNLQLAARIFTLKAEGHTAPQIREKLKAEGENLSIEGVEAYLKTRYKRRK